MAQNGFGFCNQLPKNSRRCNHPSRYYIGDSITEGNKDDIKVLRQRKWQPPHEQIQN